MPGLYIDPTSSPVDFIFVVFGGPDGLRTPGKCKLSGWERPVEYDHKAGKGTKGALQTLKGLPPAKGKIEFETWTEEQRNEWTPILDMLKFDPTKLPASNAAAAAPKGNISVFTGNTPNTTTNNQPAPLSSAFAIEISHPFLADIDVHYVLPPEKIGIWEPVGEDWSHCKRTIEFVEFTGEPPNQSIATTPTGADPTAAPASPGTPPLAGTNEGAAAGNQAASQAGAVKDAQGAWGSTA